MGCKLCKSEDLNEKEHENSIGDHRLARSKEQEVKKKLGRISRENGPKMGEKSAYDEQEKQIIDKRLSEFTERDRNKRSAKKPIILIPRAENGYFSSRSSLWDAEATEDHFPTIPHDLIPSRPSRQMVPPRIKCNRHRRSRLLDAKEAEDHYPTIPHVQVLSSNINSPASPPPDHLDDFNPGSQQQQQMYNPPPDIGNNIPHFLVISALIPPSAPPSQDLLEDLNPNNQQQQQHIYITPSDIESDVFDEDLHPNHIIPPYTNPAPPPPDYLE